MTLLFEYWGAFDALASLAIFAQAITIQCVHGGSNVVVGL